MMGMSVAMYIDEDDDDVCMLGGLIMLLKVRMSMCVDCESDYVNGR